MVPYSYNSVKEYGTVIRLCKYCESEFEPNISTQRYCSKECANKGHTNSWRYGGNHYKVLKRDKFQCVKCESSLDLCVHHFDGKVTNTSMSNLITLCRSCHTSLHSKGSANPAYRKLDRATIEKAIAKTANLDEAAEVLEVSRGTLRNRRELFGMDRLPNARKGEDNPQYIHITLAELEMAYELECTWVKAAKRLGISESFARRRYKELKGLTSVKNRIYKDVSKEDVLQAFEQGGNWKEAAKILGISKKTMTAKRVKYDLK